jgi:prepilin-type processing-associated H-X9-DG protein
MTDVLKGTSSTIAVVHSNHKVPWAAPADLVIDVKKPLNLGALKSPHSGDVQTMFLDGSVRIIRSTTPESRIRSLLSIAGDEQISEGSY